MFVITFITGYVIMKKIYRNENKNPDDVDALGIYVFVGTVIGARLGHCLFYSPEFYLSNPIKIFYI
jgi:prolipoprotein diacylglyceryltransferase